MMNFKLSFFITLSLFVLTVFSQQDPKAGQESNANTGSASSSAASAAAAAFASVIRDKPTSLGCIPYCAEQPNTPTLGCLVKCIKN